MKKMKRLLALVMAMAMVLGMALTSSAETNTTTITGTPSSSDKATVTVKGVEANATIKAYQITTANYDTSGFLGYRKVTLKYTDTNGEVDLTVNNALAPTANEITAIANAISSSKLGISAEGEWTYSESNKEYTSSLGAGYWLIIVENTNTTIYNPMLAGVYYENEDGTSNTLEGGIVDATQSFKIGSETVYAKSTSVPTLDKEIDTTDDNKKGNDLAIGDSVSFKITTQIPDYSDAYENVVFYIIDELSEGLSFDLSSFKLNAQDLPEGVTADYVTENSVINYQKVKINFTEEYVKQNGNATATITYTATLNDKAGVNFDANTNKAQLTYTNKPGNTTTGEEKKTYHYTFALDGMLNGQNGVDTIKTTEVVKVNEDGTVQNEYSETDKTTTTTVTGALDGATFQLYKKDGNNAVIEASIKTSTSDTDGYFNFSGLDAGTYYLKETKAPEGYQLNTKEHTVVIAAKYNENGTLANYTITIDGARISTYTATYEGETITEIDANIKSTTIKNTELASLPSTGGIGTTIFTVGGCIIMIAAAALYFASKRRTEEQ